MGDPFPYVLAAGLTGAMVMIGWMGLRHRRLSQGTTPHVFVSGASRSFVGAASTGSFHASWPLARLDVDREWAHVGGRGLRFVDDIWVRRHDVASVTFHRGFGRGVSFVSDDERYSRVFFRGTNQGEVLDAFREFAWPVEPGAS